jgi:AraC family transcriptional regulator
MQHDRNERACGDPSFERSLFPQGALARWMGLPIAWTESSPHQVRATLTSERNGLVMIDAGATQADFHYGVRAMSCEFTPGAIGFFAVGTELADSRWRWRATRRIALDLDAALPGAEGLLDTLRDLPRRTQIEFHDDELASVLRVMAAEVADGCPRGRLFAESLSLGVALRLQERAARTFERGKLMPAQLQRVQDLVDAQLARDLSLAQLAACTGFSPSQFVRLFKNTFGCTPHQYVLRARLARARALVVDTELSLAAVASATGFSSQSHLTSAFVRAFGVPPGKLRRMRVPSAFSNWVAPKGEGV